MPGEGDLLHRREDADAGVPPTLGGQHEDSLRQVHLAGQLLHAIGLDVAAVGEHRHRVAGERRVRGDVRDDVPQVPILTLRRTTRTVSRPRLLLDATRYAGWGPRRVREPTNPAPRIRSTSPPARAASPPRVSMKLWPPPPEVDAASAVCCGPLLVASVTRFETVPVSAAASMAFSCCAGVSPSRDGPALLVVSVTRLDTVPVSAAGPELVVSVTILDTEPVSPVASMAFSSCAGVSPS